MTRIEQPHHSIRWRRGEPSIEWGHAQVLARSSGARAARVRPRGRRQRTVLCHTSHARNAFHIVHHHPWSTLPAAGSWLSAPGSSTVPTTAATNRIRKRKRRAPPPDADARPVFVRSVTAVRSLCGLVLPFRAVAPGSGVPESVAGRGRPPDPIGLPNRPVRVLSV